MPSALSPQEFVAHWRNTGLKERSAAQSQSEDLRFIQALDSSSEVAALCTHSPLSLTLTPRKGVRSPHGPRRPCDARLNPPDASEQELQRRTLANLYNQRPTWLQLAHRTLDEAVFAAYGWPAELTDDEVLRRLLELNLERVAP